MAVYKKSNNWWVDFYYQGERCRRKIGPRRRDAVEALSRIKVSIASGTYVDPSQQQKAPSMLSYADFCRQEFLPWSEGQHSPGHYRRLKSIIEHHLIPWVGTVSIDEVSTKQIDAYLTSRRRDRVTREGKQKAVSVATINRELCAFKVSLSKAEAWDYISENPAAKIKVMKESPRKPRLLEPAEVAALLAEMPDHLHALVACAVYAGLRRSELFHLRWEDADLKEGELRVVSRADHPTKNRETRHIPMSAALREALTRHPHRLGSPYVFVNAEGKPYDNIRKSLNSAAERAGIREGVGLHQLRHCFISHCAMASVDPRTLMKWAGHHDLKTTMGYSHVSAGHEKAAIERLQYHHGHPAVTETG
jgi:integrase